MKKKVKGIFETILFIVSILNAGFALWNNISRARETILSRNATLRREYEDYLEREAVMGHNRVLAFNEWLKEYEHS